MRKECNLLQSNSHTRTSKEAEEWVRVIVHMYKLHGAA